MINLHMCCECCNAFTGLHIILEQCGCVMCPSDYRLRCSRDMKTFVSCSYCGSRYNKGAIATTLLNDAATHEQYKDFVEWYLSRRAAMQTVPVYDLSNNACTRQLPTQMVPEHVVIPLYIVGIIVGVVMTCVVVSGLREYFQITE